MKSFMLFLLADALSPAYFLNLFKISINVHTLLSCTFAKGMLMKLNVFSVL